ncbi:MAG: toll/interleukin-1 receptor domain-containing protein [Clostridia bacterium]|nr:toll/interleukin-1 receptor domain-containing protein [Clostridia bacterium]
MGKQSNRVPAYGGDNPYIFISYSHKDTARVLPVIAAMQDKGYRIWYDQGIEAGSEWSNNIAKHLRDCSAFVAFVSKYSMASENCLDEIAYAKSNNKPSLMIFLEEEVELPAGVEMQTARFQRMFYTEDTDIAGFVGQVEGARMLSACRGDDAYEYYNSVREGAAHGNNVGGGSKVRKLRAAMIVGGAVVVILFVVFAIFMMSQSSSQNEDMTSEHTDTETTESENTNESENTTAEDTQEETSEETSVETEPEETEPEETETQKPEIVMSDDLADLTFMLCGEVYQLPMSYSELEADGWMPAERTITINGTPQLCLDILVGGHSSTSLSIVKNGNEVACEVYNPSGDARKIKNCIVVSIIVAEQNNVDFAIAKGIKAGDDESAVREAFGIPSYSSAGMMRYNFEDRSVTFSHRTSNNAIIELYSMHGVEFENTETRTERPDYLNEYVKPDELGDDILSGNVELFDGLVIRMPAPLYEFLDNGWEIASAPSSYVVSGGESELTLQKDDHVIKVTLMNYSDYQTTLENCAVIKLAAETSTFSPQKIVTLAGGVCLGMSYEEVKAHLPMDNFEEREGTSIYSDFYWYSGHTTTRMQSIKVQVSREYFDHPNRVFYYVEIKAKWVEEP